MFKFNNWSRIILVIILLLPLLMFADETTLSDIEKSAWDWDWKEILACVVVLLEIALRLIPTGRVYSIISGIIWVINRILPDLAKDGNGRIRNRNVKRRNE